jgi:hypothetical protein
MSGISKDLYILEQPKCLNPYLNDLYMPYKKFPEIFLKLLSSLLFLFDEAFNTSLGHVKFTFIYFSSKILWLLTCVD